MTRKECLAAAKICVCGEREQDYGSPEDNFRTIANLWSAYLLAKPDPGDILPVDVAAMMALLKIARISNSPAKEDNWVDLAGYAACGAEIETERRVITPDTDSASTDSTSSVAALKICNHQWVYIPEGIRKYSAVKAPYICSECGAESRGG